MAYIQLQEQEDQGLRIVLVGRTGAGKSSAGNTILGRMGREGAFNISMKAPSRCQKETGLFDCQKLTVVDTPGLFDTKLSKDEVNTEIARCIAFSAPGPHVVLVVIQPNRFTKKEEKIVKIIQKIFGERAAQYTMVLFTRGDDLEADGISIDEVIENNNALSNFINQPNRTYHVFNNRNRDPSQVRELLEKINTLVQDNEGCYHTNQMFKKVEKAIEKEMEKIRRENPNMGPEEARKKAESSIESVHLVSLGIGLGAGAAAGVATGIATGIGIEAAVGATIGLVGGPVGAAVGAAVGVAAGAAGTAIAVAVKQSDCNCQ